MGYCCKKLQQTKTVTLTFKRSELLYDVENCSFVEGDIMETENEHARHQVFDIGQSGNVNRVTCTQSYPCRMCGNAISIYQTGNLGRTGSS